LAAIPFNAQEILLAASRADREQKTMENMRLIRTLGLFMMLGLTGSSGGCGPTALSPADQEKVDAIIKKEHAGRHKELNDDLKSAKQARGNVQKQRAGARRAANPGQGEP
jgi:hypothetical protein